jgi:hypothetical protein
VPWRADVFRGAPQDKNSATFGTLGVNFRARKKAAALPVTAEDALVRSVV